MTDGYVEATLRERAGCLAAGKLNRVRHIDDILRTRFGIVVDDGPRGAPVDDGMTERAVDGPPEKRGPGRPRKT